MKHRVITLLKLLPAILIYSIVCSATEIHESTYFGEQPPGMTPKIFAPGIICLSNRQERSGVYSPDGQEFFLTTTYMRTTYAQLLEDGSWTPLRGLSFAPSCAEPYISPDGQRFFCNRNGDIYMSERVNNQWSQATRLAYPISSGSDEYFPCPIADGTLYFCSTRPGAPGGTAIYRSRPAAGEYRTVEQLPSPINTSNGAWDAMVAPDESYMIVAVGRSEYGQADLFISFRNEDDSWTVPRNLGPQINTSLIEYGPHLSPDNKYFFFTRLAGWRSTDQADIYWVDARAVLPDPNGPIENLSSGMRFSSIKCAVNYANDGDKIVIGPGIYQESIDLTGKTISLQSVDPNDPFYVGGTIIQGSTDSPVVTLQDNSETCEIAGMTIRTGSIGIKGTETNATIRNCRIMDNATHGLELSEGSSPNLKHCLITSNGQTGITMHAGSGRSKCEPIIENCIIVYNGQQAISGGEPIIVDSIID